jgi:hypothetical protein
LAQGLGARELAVEVADDAVAAAQMLQKRWDDNETLRVQRDGLKPDLEEAKVAAQLSEAALKEAEEALARLAATEGVETGDLEHAAGRFDARRGLEARIEIAERTAMDAGDGFSVAALKEEWGGRDRRSGAVATSISFGLRTKTCRADWTRLTGI